MCTIIINKNNNRLSIVSDNVDSQLGIQLIILLIPEIKWRKIQQFQIIRINVKY